MNSKTLPAIIIEASPSIDDSQALNPSKILEEFATTLRQVLGIGGSDWPDDKEVEVKLVPQFIIAPEVTVVVKQK